MKKLIALLFVLATTSIYLNAQWKKLSEDIPAGLYPGRGYSASLVVDNEENVYAGGGPNSKGIPSVYVYSKKNNSWEELEASNALVANTGIYNGVLKIDGNKNLYTKAFLNNYTIFVKWTAATKSWERLGAQDSSSAFNIRAKLLMVDSVGNVYVSSKPNSPSALGGFNGEHIYKFDAIKNEWVDLINAGVKDSMFLATTKDFITTSAIIDSNNNVYVLGGAIDNKYPGKLLKWQAKENRWSSINAYEISQMLMLKNRIILFSYDYSTQWYYSTPSISGVYELNRERDTVVFINSLQNILSLDTGYNTPFNNTKAISDNEYIYITANQNRGQVIKPLIIQIDNNLKIKKQIDLTDYYKTKHGFFEEVYYMAVRNSHFYFDFRKDSERYVITEANFLNNQVGVLGSVNSIPKTTINFFTVANNKVYDYTYKLKTDSLQKITSERDLYVLEEDKKLYKKLELDHDYGRTPLFSDGKTNIYAEGYYTNSEKQYKLKKINSLNYTETLQAPIKQRTLLSSMPTTYFPDPKGDIINNQNNKLVVTKNGDIYALYKNQPFMYVVKYDKNTNGWKGVPFKSGVKVLSNYMTDGKDRLVDLGLTLDATGNLLVSGMFYDPSLLGKYTPVVKLNSETGELEGIYANNNFKEISGATDLYYGLLSGPFCFDKCVSDRLGNIYVFGVYRPAGGSFIITLVFTYKADSKTWQKQVIKNMGLDPYSGKINTIAKDSAENLYLAGEFFIQQGIPVIIKWEKATATASVLCDSASTFLYRKKPIYTMLIDSSENNMYFGGEIKDSVTKNNFVYKLNLTNKKFSKTSIAVDDAITSLCADDNHNIYIAGNFSNSQAKHHLLKYNIPTESLVSIAPNAMNDAFGGAYNLTLSPKNTLILTGNFLQPSYCYKLKEVDINTNNYFVLGTKDSSISMAGVNSFCVGADGNNYAFGYTGYGGFIENTSYCLLKNNPATDVWVAQKAQNDSTLFVESGINSGNLLSVDSTGSAYVFANSTSSSFANLYKLNKTLNKWEIIPSTKRLLLKSSIYINLYSEAVAAKNGDIFIKAFEFIGSAYPEKKRLMLWEKATNTWHFVGDTNFIANSTILTIAPEPSGNLYVVFRDDSSHKIMVKLWDKITNKFNELQNGNDLDVYGLDSKIVVAENGMLYLSNASDESYWQYTPPINTPVKLLEFNAKKQLTSQVLLDWSTLTEINTSDFEVQKSTDGKTFYTFTSVPTKGNTTTKTAYTVVDKNPEEGNNFYRLKINENNGTYTFSEVRVVSFKEDKSVKILPNPATDYVAILGKSIRCVELFNINGKRIKQIDNISGMSSVYINLQDKAKGVYLITVVDGNGIKSTHKIVKN